MTTTFRQEEINILGLQGYRKGAYSVIIMFAISS